MLLAALPVVTSLMAISPAFATGGVHCISEDEKVEISIGMGRVPIFAPLNADVHYGKRHWSSRDDIGAEPLGGSQGMLEEERFSADFTDENVEKIIISLRVDMTEESSEGDLSGTLTFEDKIIHQVKCQFE